MARKGAREKPAAALRQDAAGRSERQPQDAAGAPEEPLPGGDELAAFLDSLRYEENDSAHTVRSYGCDLEDYLRWAHRRGLDPFSVTHKQARRYLGELDAARYSKATVNRRLSALKGFFRWLNAMGVVEVDPVASLQGPKKAARLPKSISPCTRRRLPRSTSARPRLRRRPATRRFSRRCTPAGSGYPRCPACLRATSTSGCSRSR